MTRRTRPRSRWLLVLVTMLALAGLAAPFAAAPAAGAQQNAAPVDCAALGLLPVGDTGLCTSGPDMADEAAAMTAAMTNGTDGAVDAEAAESDEAALADLPGTGGTKAAGGANAAITCDGNGTSGKRVQVLYARSSDVPSRYGATIAKIRAWVGYADEIYNYSAMLTGGSRHIRFVHDANCQLVLTAVKLSPTGDDNLSNMINELAAKGYNRTDRKYIIIADTTAVDNQNGSYCGIATTPGDEQPGAANASNTGPSYARIMSSCWGGVSFNTGHLIAHELTHALGAVHAGAPHSTSDGHCTDGADVMCGGGSCGPSSTYTYRLDCNGDDYFNVNPGVGNYLATHWNIANSQFLIAGPLPPTTCRDAAVEPDSSFAPLGVVTVGVVQPRAFCDHDDFDSAQFDLMAGVPYTIQTFNLGFGANTSMQLYDPSSPFAVANNDDGEITPGASLINYTPVVSGRYTLNIQNVARDQVTDGKPAYDLLVTAPGMTPPDVTRPRYVLLAGQTLQNPSAGVYTIRGELRWTVNDVYGVVKQLLQEKVNAGGYADSGKQPAASARSAALTLAVSSAYRHRIQVSDSLGQTSAFKLSTAVFMRATQESSSAIAYTGTWTRTNNPALFGGRMKSTAGGAGAKATFTFTGSSVALVGAQRASGGTADVYLDGVKLQTLTFHSATARSRRVLFTRNNLSAGTHTLELRWVSGRIYLDGFITAS